MVRSDIEHDPYDDVGDDVTRSVVVFHRYADLYHQVVLHIVYERECIPDKMLGNLK